MKKHFITFSFIAAALGAHAQQDADKTFITPENGLSLTMDSSVKTICIPLQQYKRDQQLQTAICNVLQYMTMDGKVTNKKEFERALSSYMELITPNARSPSK